MTSTPAESAGAPWPKMATEGLVIIVSILLAFSIDAWWDARGEARDVREELALLAHQMEANRGRLAEITDGLERVTSSADALVDAIQPEPTLLSQDSLFRLVGRTLTFPDPAVESAALESILGGAQARGVGGGILRDHLLSFRADLDYLEDNFPLLRERREDVIAHLVRTTPLASASAPPDDETAFPFPTESVLADPQLEGLLLNLRLRAGNVLNATRRLGAMADSIVVDVAEVGAS
jgi:hypothetical protein